MTKKLSSYLLSVIVIIGLFYGAFYYYNSIYYKLSDGALEAQINAFKANNIDYVIKEDGSVWIRRSDENKVAQCCT